VKIFLHTALLLTGTAVLLLSGSLASAAACSLPNTFTNGQTADATLVMQNFNALLACINSGSAPGGSANSLQYNAGGGILGGVSPLTNGQLAVGSTGNPPQPATITAGAGITVANSPGSITIGATGGGGATGLYNQVMSATPTSAGTGLTSWLNQGTATVADTAVGIAISDTNGNQLRVRYKAAPTPPYTITALVGDTTPGVNTPVMGIGWYDGTSKLHVVDMVYNNGWGVEVTKWNSVSSWNSYDFSPTPIITNPLWLQIRDDGTSIYFRYSVDGANFYTLYNSAKSGAWLGSSGYNNIMFFISTNANNVIGTLMSWTQGS
jgi:hypothetical protein